MDRNFILPATVAVALHGALLFGFKSDRIGRSDTSGSPPRDVPAEKRVKFVLAQETTADQAPECQGSPENVRPEFDEPPPPADVVQHLFQTPVSPTQDMNRIIPVIPPGPVGLSSGVIEGSFIQPRGSDVLRIGDLDRTPRTRVQTAPTYPYQAKAGGHTGTVTVDFIVDETCSVLSPRVVETSNPMFNESAVRAVARWKFEPGKRGGQVVRFRMAVPIVFTLNAE